MNSIEMILFDIDGVLVDTVSILKKIYIDVGRHLNVASHTQEQFNNALNMPPRRALQHIFGNNSNKAVKIFNYLWKEYLKHAIPFEGVGELLEDLSKHHIFIGAVTSRNNSDAMALLSNTELYQYMRILITWGHYRVSKPSPACLLVALNKTQKVPSATAYVGDQAIDMLAASNAGVLGIGAVWDSNTERTELEKAGADIIVEKPGEIVTLFT